MMRPAALVLALCALFPLGACALASGRSVDTPRTAMGPSTAPAATTAHPTPTASATPLPTDTPAPTSSATPAPTLDPDDVAAITEAGQALLAGRGLDPLCLRWEDTDDDGEPEWVGLHLQPGDPPRLEGFVADGEAWHQLRAPTDEGHGLGRYPTCELAVEDVNADGSTEILIYGHAKDNADLLHIFVWRAPTYDLLASFHGNAGIEIQDIDGNLSPEILARHAAGDGLAWEAVHTWDGAHYAWTWERYTWLHADYPHAYPTDTPEHAVISFYLALDGRDLPGAHQLFSAEARASEPYETWAAGFDTMLAAEVGSVQEMDRSENTAMVTAQVRAYDNLEGYVVGRLWDVTWSLVREEDSWRLAGSSNEQLARWEAPYFP